MFETQEMGMCGTLVATISAVAWWQSKHGEAHIQKALYFSFGGGREVNKAGRLKDLKNMVKFQL